jgi:succinoglycan biosynthesis transport protein ExoP
MNPIQLSWRSAGEHNGQVILPYAAPHGTSEEPARPVQYESLQDLLRVLKAYHLTIISVAATVFFVVLLVCLIMTPQYTSTATIEVNREASVAPNGGTAAGIASTQVDDVQTEVATDARILQRPELALQVIHELDLAKYRPFIKEIPADERGLPLDRAPITRERFIRAFEKSLKVELVPDTRLIQVTFRNPDPAIAANVANTISELFISDSVNRRVDSTSEVSFWISKQLATLKKQVGDSEQALADFEHKTGLAGIDMPSDQTGNSLAMQGHNSVLDRLTSLNQELTTAEASRISSGAVYRLIQTQDPEVVLGLGSMGISSGGTVLGQGGGLDLLRNLRAMEIPLKTEYADLATKYGAKNPRLVQLQNQLNALESEIRDEIRRIGKRAENDYLYAKNNEDAIRARLSLQQEAADKLTDQSVQLQLLAQEAFSNRKLYESLFSQLHEANIAAGIRATHLSIVDRGQVTGLPVIPNYPLALEIAAFAGVFLGIVVAFIRRSLDNSVRLPKDVESAVQMPVMAYLPLFSTAKATLSLTTGGSVLIDSPGAPISESFRALRTSILFSRPDSKSKILLITSPAPGDGKSTVAFNLAVAFAQQRCRVLLIDGDMRNASLHKHFGVPNKRGLSDALSDQPSGLNGLLTGHETILNLFLLSAGSRPMLPVELFGSITCDLLLAEARETFDWILIDSPPFLQFSDAAVLASKVDAVLPVIRSGITSRTMLTTTTDLLHRMRAPVIGFVLNGVKESAISLHYGYGDQKKREKDEHAHA